MTTRRSLFKTLTGAVAAAVIPDSVGKAAVSKGVVPIVTICNPAYAAAKYEMSVLGDKDTFFCNVIHRVGDRPKGAMINPWPPRFNMNENGEFIEIPVYKRSESNVP